MSTTETEALTADEVRRLCEALRLPSGHSGFGVYWKIDNTASSSDLPCSLSVFESHPLGNGTLYALATVALAECAKPARGNWRCVNTDHNVYLNGGRMDEPMPHACDHTDPLSVATAQCRAALEVLT